MSQQGFQAIFITVFASVMMILAGIVYFGVTLWIIKIACELFFGIEPNVNWSVLAASIMAVGAILAGAIERRNFQKHA